MTAPKKIRAGSYLYNGFEVPKNAEIKIYENRECYLSGISIKNDYLYKTIRYLDNGVYEVHQYEINSKLEIVKYKGIKN